VVKYAQLNGIDVGGQQGQQRYASLPPNI
jgi:hypothetical protein